MILSHIIGGLGNQMFQYATAKALALHFDTSLALDISDFSGYGLHQGFELSRVFNISADLADQGMLRRLVGWQAGRTARRLLKKRMFAPVRSSSLIVEPGFGYWPGIRTITLPAYLLGYWQSEQYFADVADVIRQEFSFKLKLEGRNIEMAERISSENAVSLHVRRGDYVKDKKTLATHGVCSLEYYQLAVSLLVEQVKKPVFYVFSDDIPWVRDNLRIDFPVHYVDHNTSSQSYNDMRLMSLCKHHIIANSSFSWWGAWLNPDAGKIVYTPKNWFANGTDTSDLIPASWVRI